VNRMRVRQTLHYLAAVLGIALLVVLVRRTGTGTVIHQVRTIGWGFGLVLVLGGIGHLIKTWAWRLTFACEIQNVSFARTFALRLVSEAIAIIGLPGQVIGEAARVSLLGSDVPIANSISSVTLDRVLYIVTSAIITFTGMIAALLLVSFSRMWRLYALLFALGAAALLAASAVALRRRWPVFSGVARAIGRITWFTGWLDGKRSVIESAEKNFFDFYYDSPGTFWQSLALNVACHGTAILEVYILLCFMGARSGLFLALVLEALTKLINTVGTFNPGNVGTYEGGNMIIFRLLGISSAAGLTMALCRRARILFWAVIGALCLIVMSRATGRRKLASTEATGQTNAADLLLSQIPCDSIPQ
jgi:Lysylphosphatidylglycerol synthase TM region